jgi:hypothetical protein
MAGLDPAIHAFFLLIFIFFTTAALASSMSQTDYQAAMAQLDDIETLIASTISDLQNGMPPEAARAALPHLQERLQWMRDAKVAAARVDTGHTLRARNTESQRARCIIMRAGLMDSPLQDVMVNMSMKARGAADNRLIPASAAPMAGSNAIFRCGSL